MSFETTALLVFAVVALVIGGVLTRVWRRHLARQAKARAKGTFMPRIDARGVWLLLNGPVTLALGVVLLAVAGLDMRAELAEARRVRELREVVVRCEPSHATFELLGGAARRVDVRLVVALLEGDREGATLRLSPPGPIALRAGAPRTFDTHVAGHDVGGEESVGMRFTVVIRDADGEEVATGERECSFPGRDVRLAPFHFEF